MARETNRWVIVVVETVGGFEPANEAHAIVSAAITIQFAGGISDAAWPALRSAAIRAGRKLGIPAPTPFFGLSLSFDSRNVNVALNAPSPTVGQASGLSFIAVTDDDVVSERFVAARDTIIISTNAYVRWQPFAARAGEFLEAVYAHYAPLGVASVQFEYWDRFNARPDQSHDVTRLLKAGTPWVGSDLTGDDQPWHAHSGKVLASDVSPRRVLHVDVDYGDYLFDGVPMRSLLAHTMLQDSWATPQDPMGAANMAHDDILHVLGGQHSLLKDILATIISSDAATRISL